MPSLSCGRLRDALPLSCSLRPHPLFLLPALSGQSFEHMMADSALPMIRNNLNNLYPRPHIDPVRPHPSPENSNAS